MKPKSQILKRIDGMEDGMGNTSAGVNMVVIKNTGLPEQLKSYIGIKPTEVNKSVYSGCNSVITVNNGLTMYRSGSTAPNGVIIEPISLAEHYTDLPDLPIYSDVDFSPCSVYQDSGKNIELRGFALSYNPYTTNSNGDKFYNVVYKTYVKETGESIFQGGRSFAPYPQSEIGVSLVFDYIHGPGSKYDSIYGTTFISEYGYVTAALFGKTGSGNSYYFNSLGSIPIPFSSMEEYNNAVTLDSVSQNMAVLNRIRV